MAARRRTTLGNVTAATLNVRAGAAQASQQRASLAPAAKPRASLASSRNGRFSVASAGAGRPSLNASFAKSVQGARPSLAAASGRKSSTGVRRSGSAYGSGSANRQDPRPVSDKAFVNASIRALVEYLVEHGYDQPISAKILTRPSGRDFNNIMAFLFRQLDPQWQPAGPRFEDEVIPMLKVIRYPFTVSKASLQAVGAPQTWPKMLAVISWIVELLVYDQEVQAHEQELQDRRAAGENDSDADAMDPTVDDRAFFGYLGRAYRCFLDGDDDKYAVLEQELIGGYEAQSAQAEAEADELAARNDELRRKIAEVCGRAEVLPSLQQRLEDLRSDRGKFEQLVVQLQSHRAALTAKLEARGAEEARLKAEATELSDQVAALRERVAGQELSAEDVARMARERQRLRDGIAAAAEQRAAAQSRGYEAEAALAARLDALEAAAHAYGARAAALQLVPASAKNASGMDYEVNVCRSAVAADADASSLGDAPLLSNDVRGVVRPALGVLKAAVATRVQEARQELLELLDAEESSEEELAELTEQTRVLEAKVRRAEEQYRRDKETADAAATAAAEEAAALEERLAAAGSGPEEAERRSARLLATAAQLRVALETQREAAAHERDALHAEVLDALGLCTDRKEAVQQRLAELREVAEQVRSAIVDSEDPVAAAMAAPLPPKELLSGAAPASPATATAVAASSPAAAGREAENQMGQGEGIAAGVEALTACMGSIQLDDSALKCA